MITRLLTISRRLALASAFAFIASCSSSDDSGDSMLNENLPPSSTVSLSAPMLPTLTVPPATGADTATGTIAFDVDTVTGAVTGSATVSGTTGTPTAAHIHAGAVGATGPILIPLNANADGTVWSTGPNDALDAAGIALFTAGELYVNVHTEANGPGELRAQMVNVE